MTRTVGVILIVVAVVVALVGSGFLVSGLTSGRLEAAGAILGFGLLLVVLVAPLAVGGIVVMARGRQEVGEQQVAERQRKILDMVKTRGQVHVSDIIIELQSDQATVQDMIYRLVGLGVFSGYVNWDQGVLYSADAAALRELEQCRNCGGNLSLAGKGVIKCPYCGTEYFLP